MAGHSKWANIKHKKGALDAKRGKVFTKLAKSTSAPTVGWDVSTFVVLSSSTVVGPSTPPPYKADESYRDKINGKADSYGLL